MKIAIRCSVCNGENVSRDAWGEWDGEAQDWVLRTVFDHAHCHDCEDETSLIEVPLAGERA